MNRIPFPGYSYRYYGYYPRYPKTEPPIAQESNSLDNDNKRIPPAPQETHDENSRGKKSSKSSAFTFNFNGLNSIDQPIITLLGISLFLDDLIILGLLYVLYQEEVKDEMLFICLLLLLLS